MHKLIPVALLLALLGIGLLPAVAQEATEMPINPGEATHLRVAHFSPDALAVDVWIDTAPSNITGLTYPSVTDWISLPAGAHELGVVPSGGVYADAIIGPMNLELLAQQWYTLAVVGSPNADTITAVVLEENVEDVRAGTSRFTFFQGIDGTDSLDFYRDTIPFTTGMGFTESFSIDDDSATQAYQIVTSGDQPQVLAELPELIARETYSYLVAAIGSIGGTGEAAPRIVVVPTPRAEYLVGMGALAAPGTIVQAVEGEDLTGDLASALATADLTDLLEGEGPFTLFAPAELNLANLPSQDPTTLAQILSNHVVEGEYLAQDLADGGTLTTLSGNTLELGLTDNGLTVNGLRILTANIPATNGVIHLIGGILEPPPTD